MYRLDMEKPGEYILVRKTNKNKVVFRSKGESLSMFWAFISNWAIQTMGTKPSGTIELSDGIKLILLLGSPTAGQSKVGTMEYLHQQDFNYWINQKVA